MTHIDMDTSSIPEAIPQPKAPKEMIGVTEKDGLTTVRINSSSLGILQSCPRKAQYALHMDLARATQAPALLFGSAIHAAMEVFYAGTSEERTLPTNMTKNLDLMAGGVIPNETEHLVYRATRAFIDKAAPLATLPAAGARSIQNGIWTLGHYFNTYIDDPYEVYCDDQGPFIERRLETQLYNDNSLRIILFGTIDLALRNKANGQILVCDHKTSSRIGPDFFNRLKPNHQYTGYLYLAHKETDLNTDTFLVNGIEVKAKPKTARGSNPKFVRQPTKRTAQDFKEFENSVIYYVEQYLGWCNAGVFPMGHVDACAMYGGCGFHEVCSAHESIRENIIANSFIVRGSK
jgi:hypothetical protein